MSKRVSVTFSDPLWKDGGSSFLGNLENDLSSYNDVVIAVGGYDSASFGISNNIQYIEEWIENGLGRHIETFNPSLETRWEGFVNSIQVSIGPLSFTRGPLLNVANNVKGKYTDFSSGVADETSFVPDTDSQNLFGIHKKIINVGKVSSTTANNILNTYVNENKYPESSQSLGDSGGLSLSVSCLGYYHMMKYIYNKTSVDKDSTYTLREKIIDVIGADINSLISSDESQLTTNTLSVFEYENEDKPAFDLIKEMLVMGSDANNNRMLFGIYGDRVPEYRQVPTDILYTQRLSDVGVNLQTQVGGEVEPWDVQVGQWVQFTDFLIGRDLPNETFREDPRVMFIESISYTAPYSISISGGKVDTLTQQLAKLGLGGIS